MSCFSASPLLPSSSHCAPPSYIAVFGHSGSQAPQLMHSSVMAVDIQANSEKQTSSQTLAGIEPLRQFQAVGDTPNERRYSREPVPSRVPGRGVNLFLFRHHFHDRLGQLDKTLAGRMR